MKKLIGIADYKTKTVKALYVIGENAESANWASLGEYVAFEILVTSKELKLGDYFTKG
uniref:Uncharacterized protein n=1 Tax=viral metagenome TaxID=1070528 RepID=A0A6H2A3X8_9ZZZZ